MLCCWLRYSPRSSFLHRWLRFSPRRATPQNSPRKTLRNGFCVCFVAGSDTRLGVVFYTVGSVSHRVAPPLKILLAKPCGMVLVYALSDFIHLGVDFIFICGSSPEGRAFQRKVKYSKIYCFFSYFMLIYL